MELNKYIEHTALQPTMQSQDVDSLVKEALEYQFMGVCVPAFWVKKAAREINASDLSLVTVVGFPLGYQMTQTKEAEINQAIKDGANELDIVMNISALKSGMPWVKIELAKCAHLIHEAGCMMKVIIETAYLSEEEMVRATRLACEAGTDFVKTSTGFAPQGAVAEHVALMRKTAPSSVGIKASGGIKTLSKAKEMINAGADRLGCSSSIAILEEWASQQT